MKYGKTLHSGVISYFISLLPHTIYYSLYHGTKKPINCWFSKSGVFFSVFFRFPFSVCLGQMSRSSTAPTSQRVVTEGLKF